MNSFYIEEWIISEKIGCETNVLAKKVKIFICSFHWYDSKYILSASSRIPKSTTKKVFKMKNSLLLIALFHSLIGSAQVSVKWNLTENQLKYPAYHVASFEIQNDSNQLLEAGWKLYFNTVFLSVRSQMLTEGFEIEHLAGDFFVLKSNEETSSILSGETKTVSYRSRDGFLKNSYAPEGLILQKKGGAASEVESYQSELLSSENLQEMAAETNIPIPSAESIFLTNESISVLNSDQIPPFLPIPKRYSYRENELTFEGKIGLKVDSEFMETGRFLKESLSKVFEGSIELNSENPEVLIYKKAEISAEGYELEINEKTIRIAASTSKGAFYGVQSLLALLTTQNRTNKTKIISFPQIKIEDAPTFGYRGFFLDIARNFLPKDQIFRVLDLMAMYKLNTFHFQMVNDEGWRIEIPGLPELTEYGAKRGFSEDEQSMQWPFYASGSESIAGSRGSGFYSKADFEEILGYATERHIAVIPEFGMPAHSRAAIKAMEYRYHQLMQEGKEALATQYRLADPNDESRYLSAQNFRDNTVCVCQESTYDFYRKVIQEIKVMYANAGATLNLWHTGGDEVPKGVWTASPICEEFLKNNPSISQDQLGDYLKVRLSELIESEGLRMAGWEEVGQRQIEFNNKELVIPNADFAAKGWTLYAWNAVAGWGGEDMAYRLANAGFPVVLSPSSNFYFDLAYNFDPEERGHTWSGVSDLYQSWKAVPGRLYLSHDQTMEGESWDWEQAKQRFTPLSETGKQHILGVQGQLWTETIRSGEMMEYYLFPKMLGYIERAWNGDPAWSQLDQEKAMKALRAVDWNVFSNVVSQRELSRLTATRKGFNFRIPVPGIKNENGVIYLNSEFPGLEVRYSLDGSEPNLSSAIYQAPFPGKGIVKAAIFDASGRSGRVSTLDLTERINNDHD